MVLSKGVKFGVKFNKQRFGVLFGAVRVLSKDKQGFGVWCGARCGC